MNENFTAEPTMGLRFILPDAPPPMNDLIGSTPILRHWPAVLQREWLDRSTGKTEWRTDPLAIIPLDEYQAATGETR